MRRRVVVASGLFAICVAMLLLSGATPHAQETPRPAFRVSTELVVVDLLATGRSQQFVSDLQPAEIQLFEDGKPQKVEFVRLVRHGTGRAPARDDATPSPPAAKAPAPSIALQSEAAGEPLRLIVAIDLVSTPADEFVRVKDAIVRMLREELPAGPEVMLVTLWHGLTVEENFTADRDRMIAAVNNLRTPLADRISFLQMVDTAQQACETGGTPAVVLAQLIGLGRNYITETRQDLTETSVALGALSRGSAALSGRKHIVLYSRGYALNAVAHVIDLVANAAATGCGGDPASYRQKVAEELSAAGDFDPENTLQRLLDDANRSQVSFYVIDPRGLITTAPKARDAVSTRGSRGGLASRAAVLEALMPQEYLRAVAGDTAGRVYLNTNDLSAGLKRAWIDASEYYLVGYVPAAGRQKGRYHRIEMKTTRPDLQLRFRRGYYDLSEKEVRANDIAKAISLPGTFAASGLEVETDFEGNTMKVTAFIDPTVIAFSRAEGINQASISLHAVLRDEKGKWVGGKELFGRNIALRLKDEQLSALRSSDNIEIPVTVSAPVAGKYQLTVVARDSGGWIGAHVQELVR
ncbi:MAG: VWA domain-containing protein [Acidobacteriota bacterium]